MNKYMVMSTHTAEDCDLAIKHFKEHHMGFFTHFDWGCYDNDHTAYAIVEADSHEVAKMTVPSAFRNKTKVIKLTTFNLGDSELPKH